MENLDELNRKTMRSAEALRRYAQADDIWPAEAAIWDRLRPEIRGRPILDLGVGGGRTVRPLRALSADYVGLDYTEEMIATCTRRHPGVRFEHGDARDLSRFPAGHFFLVTFTCNGLDMVGHEDRLQILREVHRVLMPGGAFVFTSNNQNSAKHWEGLRLPPFEPASDPLRLLVRVGRYVTEVGRSALNYRRYSKHDVRRPAYSVISERSHNYGIRVYYISLQRARQQLASVGFQQGAEAYDLAGHLIADDTHDVSICYLARK